jgi:hypothetical protein
MLDYRWHRLSWTDVVSALALIVAMFGALVAFVYLGSVLEQRTRDEGAAALRLWLMVLAGVVAMATVPSLLQPGFVRRFYPKFRDDQEELREQCRRSELIQTVEGEVKTLCPPTQLLFSPLTHRACVAWSVVTVHGSMPWNDDGARGTNVTEAIPFAVETERGVVRIERLEAIVIPRLDGLARAMTYAADEWASVRAFYHGRGGPGALFERMCDADPTSVPLPMTIYELVIPPSGWVSMLAGLYDGELDKPTWTPGDTLYIEAARVFVGTPAEVSRIVRASRRRALRSTHVAIAFAVAITASALVYAWLAYYGYLD